VEALVARDDKPPGRGVTDPGGVVRLLPRQQDVDAEFTAFFAAEYSRMVRTVYLVVHDHGHAEEIAQDAFLQLLDHWETVSGYDQPAAWVRRVAIRMAVRTGKRERMRSLLERRSRTEADEIVGPDGSSDEVLAAVRTLPTNQRAAVVLHYFEDRPVAEIADALGCAPATARVHLHKARQRLAALLHEEVDDVLG
jgi:RNA polymerase sigma-70 factor (sigma-E family)